MRRPAIAAVALTGGLAAAGGLALGAGQGPTHPAMTVTAPARGFSCRHGGAPQPVTTTTQSPSAALLAALPVLQRPAAGQDQLPANAVEQLADARGANLQAARLVATSPLGGKAWMVPVQDVPRPPLPPLDCLRDAPARVRRRMLALRRRLLARPPQPGVQLVTQGEIDVPRWSALQQIRAGHAIETSFCAGPDGNTTAVSAIVPDGVQEAHVLIRDGRHIDAQVQNNVVTVYVPHSGSAGAALASFVFTDATGAMRTTRLPPVGPVHCAPPPDFSVSQPLVPRAAGTLGTIVARSVTMTRGSGPALTAFIRRTAGRRCLTVAAPAAGAPTGTAQIDAGSAMRFCVADAALRRHHVLGSARVRPGGPTVLLGFADRTAIAYVNVFKRAGHDALTLKAIPAGGGAFFVAYASALPAGSEWGLGPLRHGLPPRHTSGTTVTLRSAVAKPLSRAASVPAFARRYAIFRRPARPSDQLPTTVHLAGSHAARRLALDFAQSRRPRTPGLPVLVWLVPGRRGICMVDVGRTGQVVGCSRFRDGALRPAPLISGFIGSRTSEPFLAALLPDGAHDAVIRLTGGRTARVSIRDNLATAPLVAAPPSELMWKDAAGQRQRFVLGSGRPPVSGPFAVRLAQKSFAVFRRRQTPRDRLPVPPHADAKVKYRNRHAVSRLLYSTAGGELRAFINGSELCTMLHLRSVGSSGCTPIRSAIDDATPTGGVTYGRGGRTVAFLIVSDRVTNAGFVDDGGHRHPLRITNNLIIETGRSAGRFVWRTRNGVQHSLSIG